MSDLTSILRRPHLGRVAIGVLLAAITALLAQPAWWSEGNPPVLDPAAAQNNHGPTTVGQAKWMVSEALRALDARDPGMAKAIRAKLTTPQTDPNNPAQNLPAILDLGVPPEPKPQAWIDSQKSPLLIGQLKAIL